MKIKQYLTESSLSRIWQMVEDDKINFGVISAFRFGFPPNKNKENHIELKKRVREMGYGYIEMKGGYKEEEGGFVNELSLFIPFIKKEEIINLGEDYKQDTVMYKDSKEFVYIGTNETTGIGKITMKFKFSKGKENIELAKNAIKDFFSSLLKGSHRGKKFIFKLEELEGMSLNRAYSLYQKNIPLKWYTIYEEDFK